MTGPLAPPPDRDRIAWLERQNDDFPYYDGQPVTISGGQWAVVMCAVAAGFAALIFPPAFLRGTVTQFVPAIVFFAVPLIALAWVAPGGWTAMFRRLRGIDIVWMIAFAVANLIVTLVVGSILVAVLDTTSNPGISALSDETALDRTLFFARAVPQLFGEEVFSILPFLAMLWLFTQRGMSRKGAIVAAMLLTAVLFAAAHLPTYGWNVLQALGGVGVARLVLIVPYLITKNIWVSTGAHILNDWMFFGLTLMGTAMTEQTQ